MKSYRLLSASVLLLCANVGMSASKATSTGSLLNLEAEAGILNPARAEVVAQDTFPSGKGVALKAGHTSVVEADGGEPDLVLRVTAPRAGRYSFTTVAAVDEAGAEKMRTARSKYESLYMRLQIDGTRATRRVVFVPWSKPQLCVQHTGTFELSGKPQELRLWLPSGTRLDRVEVRPYKAPPVPQEAAAYRPTIVPPAVHPRLWVDADSLAQVKANLTHPEHKASWDRVRGVARKPFQYAPPADREVPHNPALEQAAFAKAFCYLVADDKKAGREAVALMLAYLTRVEFGNLLDITRETGSAIYTASCVYDWCYGLFSAEERELLRKHLMRLADTMECGWPPFKGSVVNGHGNEAMINRDLLAMAIAIHDEDPVPYRYCAYRILEQLVPMRSFEYQSPRHNQGVGYGTYRFGWEMHAAWLMRRIAGREVFDGNIKRVPLYWLYMRTPDGGMLRDGDGVSNGPYWRYQQTALLCYTYNRDPILKGEYVRQGALPTLAVLYLLLDDPAMKAEPKLETLPLTIDFGPVLGGMIARTSWNIAPESADVIAEIKGGGYHFGNHRHADAGALQIFYRGHQVTRLSQYGFYGTPYDMNFSKRSVAQSMMLVIDPEEKVLSGAANDGGSRFVQSHPRTPQEAMTKGDFNYGRVQSCGFGPDAVAPDFSYFAADLQGAYGPKLTSYVRRFCFLNLRLPGNPAAMILLDDLTAKKPEFAKVWQINALRQPEKTPLGVRLRNSFSGGTMGRLDVRMLLPTPEARTLTVLSGKDVYEVGGKTYAPPKPEGAEANGHRVLVTPKTKQAHDRFLTVLQAYDQEPLPVDYVESGPMAVVRIADRVVALALGSGLVGEAFEVDVPAGEKTVQVSLAGLKAGGWRIVAEGAPAREVVVAEGKNMTQFETKGGRYRIAPTEAR